LALRCIRAEGKSLYCHPPSLPHKHPQRFLNPPNSLIPAQQPRNIKHMRPKLAAYQHYTERQQNLACFNGFFFG
jgi:hypothetical protein